MSRSRANSPNFSKSNSKCDSFVALKCLKLLKRSSLDDLLNKAFTWKALKMNLNFFANRITNAPDRFQFVTISDPNRGHSKVRNIKTFSFSKAWMKLSYNYLLSIDLPPAAKGWENNREERPHISPGVDPILWLCAYFYSHGNFWLLLKLNFSPRSSYRRIQAWDNQLRKENIQAHLHWRK